MNVNFAFYKLNKMSGQRKKRRLEAPSSREELALQFRQPVLPLTSVQAKREEIDADQRASKRRNTATDRHHHNTTTRPGTRDSGLLSVVHRERPPADTHTHWQGTRGSATRTTSQAEHVRRGDAGIPQVNTEPSMPSLERPSGTTPQPTPLSSPVHSPRAKKKSVSEPSQAYHDSRFRPIASSEASLSALDVRMQQRLAKPRPKVPGRPHARRQGTPHRISPRAARGVKRELIEFQKERVDAAARGGHKPARGRRSPIKAPVSGGSGWAEDEKVADAAPYYPPIAQSFDRVAQQFHQAHTLRRHHASTLGHKAIHAIHPHERSRFSLGQTKHRGWYGLSATPVLSVNTIGPGHFLIRARRGITKGIHHQVVHLLKRAPRAFFVNGHKHNKKQAYTIIIDLLRQNKTVEVQLR